MDKYEPDDMLTAKQASELVGYHHRTITSWIRKGWLKATKGPGERGRYMIKYSDLMNTANHPYQPRVRR